ncbi:MAG: tetratricopeptide repeat protein [Planctomycetota bacterium]
MSYRPARKGVAFKPTYPDVDPLDPNLDDTDFEIIFFEGIVDRCPEFTEALSVLGNHYTCKGFIERGLNMDQSLVKLNPDNPIAHYNLACSYTLMEKLDDAFPSLEKALDLGYCDFDHMNQDPDLALLREDPRYDDLVRQNTTHIEVQLD